MGRHALIARALSLIHGDKVAVHRKGSQRRPLTVATDDAHSPERHGRFSGRALWSFIEQFPRPPSYIDIDTGQPQRGLMMPRKKAKMTALAEQRVLHRSLSEFIPAPAPKDADMAVLEIALAYVLGNEGSAYVNDPQDHGGPTRYGVTQATLSTYTGAPASALDVQNISHDTVVAVYKALFWRPICGDKIANQHVATTLLDMAVLCGPTMAMRLIQTILAVETDGICGPKTLAAINAARPQELVSSLSLSACTYFGAIVIRDKTQAKWLAGWQKRAHKMTSLLPT